MADTGRETTSTSFPQTQPDNPSRTSHKQDDQRQIQSKSSSQSPQPEQAAAPPQDDESNTTHDQHQQPQQDSNTSPPPPPPFEPLFTLLTNTTSNTTIHPRVHYLFSDDAPSLLSAAAASSAASPSDRALVVDLAPDPTGSSWGVSWASSLTEDLAVTDAQLQKQGDGMLRLEAVEREPVEAGAGGSGTRRDSTAAVSPGTTGAAVEEDVDGLVEDFKRRMGVLRKVVGQGDKRTAQISYEAKGEDDGGKEEDKVAEVKEG